MIGVGVTCELVYDCRKLDHSGDAAYTDDDREVWFHLHVWFAISFVLWGDIAERVIAVVGAVHEATVDFALAMQRLSMTASALVLGKEYSHHSARP